MPLKRVRVSQWSVAIVAVVAAGCQDAVSEEAGEEVLEVYDPANPPAALATDDCNDPDYAGVDWLSTSSSHFTAYYLPGTAAETDIADILARREAAYSSIRTALGLTSEPTIEIYLSPNHRAAAAHGRAINVHSPGQGFYDVIYTGEPDSYERVSPGFHLAPMLDYHLDQSRRLLILSMGLSEVLDQANRNLHHEYARELVAGMESRVHVSAFERSDINGTNPGRAGSLARFLIDRYGMATFVDLLLASPTSKTPTCGQFHATYGCIDSVAALTTVLDGVLTSVTGEGWATVQPEWDAVVQAARDAANISVPKVDREAIINLVNVMDQGIVTDDPAIYRSTMDGFYCVARNDVQRLDVATRTVHAFSDTSGGSLRVFPIRRRNYPAARVMLRRREDRAVGINVSLTVEKFPSGWRAVGGPDWAQ